MRPFPGNAGCPHFLPRLPHGLARFRQEPDAAEPLPGASMFRKFCTAVLVSAVSLFLTSCTADKGSQNNRITPPDQAWVTAVSLHSNGAISRHSPVRVLFTADVVPDALVGQDASANISIEPAVSAHA